jgi:ribonuclease BN (tRNA processing enzyme)
VKVIFRGTRGSTPLVASSVTGTFRSYHSSCVELQSLQGHDSLILDGGSALGPTLMESYQNGKKTFSILLTHFHWDHILGFISFYELFYHGIKLKIYSADPQAAGYISMLYQDAYCPLDKNLVLGSFEFITVKKEITIGPYKALFNEVPHSGRTFGIEVEKDKKRVVYMPDVELTELKQSPFVESPDLLICDSFHLKADKKAKGSWGHSTAIEAVQFAQKLKAKKLSLFHYAPTYRDAEIHKLRGEAKDAVVGDLDFMLAQDDERILI